MNFFDLTARDTHGNSLPMVRYWGDTILVVNTATKCGLAPQFKELENLHQR